MKTLCLLIFLISISMSYAQGSKMNAYSSMYIKGLQKESVADLKIRDKGDVTLSEDDGIHYLKCLVKASSNSVENDIIKLGCNIITKAGDIWVLKVPVTQIDELIGLSGIIKLSVSGSAELFNDNARIDTKVDIVHEGGAGTKLKGKGVIVGVCDSGIDISHPDFIKDGKTRIKYLWDMSDNSGINYPSNFNWGREYTSQNIDYGECEQYDSFGHGTHVTGTAAGNGTGDPLYIGMAPESDIIFLKITHDVEAYERATDAEIISGVSYLFDQADKLNKPAVVNLSFGSYYGPHDGTSLLSQGLSNLTGPGKIIVASAGNSGEEEVHTSASYSADELYEIMLYPNDASSTLDEIFPDMYDYYVAFGNMWYTSNSIDSIFICSYDLNPSNNTTTLLTKTGFKIGEFIEDVPMIHNGNLLGYVTAVLDNTLDPDNQSGEAFMLIHNKWDYSLDIEEQLWSVIFKTKSDGKMDMWASSPISQTLGIKGTEPNQLYGDSKMGIAQPASGKKIISVGSYVTKNSWINEQGQTESDDIEIGSLSDFSTEGPTRDGRTAPTISAPGQYVLSALSSTSYGGANGGLYTVNAGTSMSAPVVTGIIALMLEVKPNLTFDELEEIFQKTSVSDQFTGIVPNSKCGYGKINALEAIKELIATNVEDYTAGDMKVTIYPNPASEILQIEGLEQEVTYTIFDAAGKALITGETLSSINITELNSGSYFINIVEGMDAFAIPFVVSK